MYTHTHIYGGTKRNLERNVKVMKNQKTLRNRGFELGTSDSKESGSSTRLAKTPVRQRTYTIPTRTSNFLFFSYSSILACCLGAQFSYYQG